MKCIVFNFVFVFRIHITSFSSNFTIISAFSQWTVMPRTVRGPGGPFRSVKPLDTRELVWSLINLIKIILNKILFLGFVLLNQFLVCSKSRTSIFMLSIGTRGSQRVFLIVKISNGTLPKVYSQVQFSLFFIFLLFF